MGWGGGGSNLLYTFPLRITCKKGVGGSRMACKIAYVLNGKLSEHVVILSGYSFI